MVEATEYGIMRGAVEKGCSEEELSPEAMD